MNPVRTSADFPQTSWGCVEVARDSAHPDRVAAINRLIERYWRPVFCSLRRFGHSTEDAEDRTQEFFLSVFSVQLSLVDPQRGRFRDLLFTLLRRFAHDRTVRAPRQERHERSFVSVHSLMQDSDRTYEPPDNQTAEEVFAARWKADTFSHVRSNLRTYYEHHDKPAERLRFQIFAAYTFLDPGEKPPTQNELASRFRVSRDQVRDALEQVRGRYERFLRQELREQMGAEEDVEEALRDLLS